MVKFTGYHPDRVYIPSKPIRYGFKLYLLCEGYVLQYKIHKRDNELKNKNNMNVEEHKSEN